MTFKRSFAAFVLGAILALGIGFMGTKLLSKQHSVPFFAGAPKATDAAYTEPTPQRGLEDSISNSRQNAITRTVSICSPAVVGINVTQVQTVVSQPNFGDPFGFFSNDPFFRQFFGPRKYKQEIKALGSGFIISSDGYIVTNDHVAGNATKIIVTMTGGKQYDAKLVGTDPASDVALLKIEGDNFPYIRLGNSDDVLVGEWAIAFGNPFGFFEANDHPTVTVGVVSNTNVNLQPIDNHSYTHMIQTDAAINPGNSGGPLVDAGGAVIGMNAAIYNPSGGEYNIGLGFAIPINRVGRIIELLKKNGRIKHINVAELGFRYQQLSAQLAAYFHLDQTDGVVVTQVQSGSGAAAADLEVGDVITRVNGEAVHTEDDLTSVLLEEKPGDTLTLKIYRYGVRKTILIALNSTAD